MPPEVDLVITFRASSKASLSKQQLRDDALKAEQQYAHLLQTLSSGGLRAVGRRGESLGHILVFVLCPKSHVDTLVKRERHSDFLYGLPTVILPSDTVKIDSQPLSPAERIRLVHSFITSSKPDGGLGVIPGSPGWDLVESVMALHDREFNDTWNRSWTLRQIASVQLSKIREQFGDSVALYFAFLSSYTQFLTFPALLGTAFYLFKPPHSYSPVYSLLLLLWSLIFVEYWRVYQRLLSLRFGTRGSFRVEKRRAQYTQGFPWWKREVRMLASVPVISMFAAVLGALLTAIFIFEAFVTQLYTGPGHKYLAFAPTILFVALVPRLLSVYQASATRFTNWENHAHQSTHEASLTLKTFALSAIVAYLGLALSAFVYVPFGEGTMRWVQVWLFDGGSVSAQFFSTSTSQGDEKTAGIWDVDASNVTRKLNPERLKDQMFAYTVTNQAINTFVEIGLPYILRAISSFRSRRSASLSTPSNPGGAVSNGGGGKKKRVVFEDEQEKGGLEEREFLERVRKEVALPEYELFGDYSEMVTQFGYVVLWSTIWPLASAMAFLNNVLELRSDAFKMTVHNRRPIPSRTDTIGPWLDTLEFLTWVGALTNSALVYLFCPRSSTNCENGAGGSTLHKVHQRLIMASGGIDSDGSGFVDGGGRETKELLLTALLIALGASHGYMIVKAVVRHVVERIMWKESAEVKEREEREREVREAFLKGLHIDEGNTGVTEQSQNDVPAEPFWQHDEGQEEIQRISKEA